MPFVNNQGINIHYQVEGTIESNTSPLLLHHGFTQNLNRWHLAGYIEALRTNYKLILIDARGHGESDKPYDSEAYALELRVSDVVTVLDTLEIDKIHYWGFSMGGRVGFGVASSAPSRLESLIVGGSHPYGRKIPAHLPKLDGNNPDAFLEGFFGRIGVDFKTVPAKIKKNIMENDFRALAAAMVDYPSLENSLATITVPSLIYCGNNDRNYNDAARCVEQLPNASFIPIEGFNHAQAFNQAERVLPHVTSFLKKT